MILLVNSIKPFETANNTKSTHFLPENRRGKNTFHIILWGQHCPDIKNRQREYQKRLTKISHGDRGKKILNKILTSQIEQYIKRAIHYDKVEYI